MATTLHPYRPDLYRHMGDTKVPAEVRGADTLTVAYFEGREKDHGFYGATPFSGDLLALYWRAGVTEVKA